jgi:hypothetical protein
MLDKISYSVVQCESFYKAHLSYVFLLDDEVHGEEVSQDATSCSASS